MKLEVERSERLRRESLAPLAARLVSSGETCLDAARAAELLAALTSFQAFEALSFDLGPRLLERRLLLLVQAGLGVSK